MKTHLKTAWISDIHLGSKDCKAEFLLDFLKHHHFETLYLVGDIIDFWAMHRRFRWPASHNQVLHTLYKLSEEGTRVIFLPGNHDQPLQRYSGMSLGNIEVQRQCIHTTAKGQRILVLHGDQFDQQVCFGAVQAWIGDKAYDLLLWSNRMFNRIRAWRGLPYWSLAGHIKKHVSSANQAIKRYQDACCQRALELGLDGVVCGHIHHPQICEVNDITYMNDGDWVENCSALVEDNQGEVRLLFWNQLARQRSKQSVQSTAQATGKAA